MTGDALFAALDRELYCCLCPKKSRRRQTATEHLHADLGHEMKVLPTVGTETKIVVTHMCGVHGGNSMGLLSLRTPVAQLWVLWPALMERSPPLAGGFTSTNAVLLLFSLLFFPVWLCVYECFLLDLGARTQTLNT